MRDGSRTLSAANPGKRPGANSTKFRDDTHWKTYLQNEALARPLRSESCVSGGNKGDEA